MLSLKQTVRVFTLTERPRQGSHIMAGVSPKGHAPRLQALLRKTPEDVLKGFRPLPWILPSFKEGDATVT